MPVDALERAREALGLSFSVIRDIATGTHAAGDSAIGACEHNIIPSDQETMVVAAQNTTLEMIPTGDSGRGQHDPLPFAFLRGHHLIEPVLAYDLFGPPACQL